MSDAITDSHRDTVIKVHYKFCYFCRKSVRGNVSPCVYCIEKAERYVESHPKYKQIKKKLVKARKNVDKLTKELSKLDVSLSNQRLKQIKNRGRKK